MKIMAHLSVPYGIANLLKSYTFQVLVIFGFICLVTVSDAQTEHSSKLTILRERIRRLETRLTEDISLIREEFYSEINALAKGDDNKTKSAPVVITTQNSSQAGLNKLEADLIVQLETLKTELFTKFKVLGEGRKQEKRIRREIQDDICLLKDEKADVAKSIFEVSDIISAKIDDLTEKVSVTENLNEVVRLLENLNIQLADNVQVKSEERTERVSDCSDLLRRGKTVSGVYTVFPETTWRPIKVYCDMDTLGGGWTVFQRRRDGSENFDRKWIDYTFGFGNLSDEFWLGNEFIHRLTSLAPQELLIELEDFENDHRHAAYGLFSVGSAVENFKLSVNFFTGNVTDSLKPNHNGLQFSTRDNGPSPGCSSAYKAGWWYGNCHAVNLNGLYLKGKHKTYADGVNWKDWRGYHYSLKRTEMKFRPH